MSAGATSEPVEVEGRRGEVKRSRVGEEAEGTEGRQENIIES